MIETALIVVFAFALGASVASFLNVVADRLPAGGSLVEPPSHCPVDGHVLKPYELVPVFSYLALRGKCRVCGSRIPARVPFVEFLGGVTFAAIGWRDGVTLDALLLVVTLSFLLVITIIDLEHKLVLNKVLM
ncbi:MAG: prepilin peptidase [Chloroflexi bacterium]|nr:prepilin peptidase [Chloroflexota bacterium]